MNIFAVDGNFYLHRIWFTLKTSRPLEEALPYAFLALVCKDALRVKATHLLITFDGPSVFRYDVYPEYKAARKAKKEATKSSDEIASSSDEIASKGVYAYLEPLQKYLNLAGVTWTQAKIYEADDLLMSLSKQWIEKYPNSKVTLGAIDKDLYQGLTDKVSLYNSIAKPNPVYIRVKEAELKKGVPVSQMIDYQTLLGDSIDSIPGFKLYGPAKVKSILGKYGSIKNWYKNGSETDRLWLITNQVALNRNRKLVTMVTTCNVPLNDKLLVIPNSIHNKELPTAWHDYKLFLYPKTKGLF